MIRANWLAVLAVVSLMAGCSGDGGSSSGTSGTSASTSSSSSGSTTSSTSPSTGSGSSGSGGSSSGGASASAPVLPAANLTCGSAQLSTSSSTSSAPSLTITVNGNDLTQVFTPGSKFTVKFVAASKSSDTLGWHIADYAGNSLALSYIDVPQGTTTANITCSSTLAGYFTVSANLKNSGATQPKLGSRPAGFASFGVLPNVADLVPATSKILDEHRVGLEGANYVEAGVCCNGTGLQPTNEDLGSTWILDARGQSTTEPNNAGQYNPSNYPIDPSLKSGTLARVITVDGIPAWASTAPSSSAFGTYPPKSFSAYQSYMAKVGQESTLIHAQYIPNQQKNYYQVTWEPDPGPATEWKGTDAQFVQLYQAAYNGVHSTDPDAAIMGPTTQGISTCAAWLTRLAPLGFTKYLDAVACHGYYALGTSSSVPPETAGLPAQLQGLRKVMAGLLSAGTKLFVTETGIAYPMGTQYSATYPTWDVLAQHAEVTVRTHLIMLGEGVDSSYLFYSADFAQDVGFGLYFNLSMGQNNFNSPNIAPKPATMAIAAVTRLIDGSRSLGAINGMPTNGYGYSFLLADKAHVMTALWANNASGDASMSYQLQVDAAGTSGTVVVFDGMGNPSNVAYTNGKATVTLTEMPIYVLSANPSVMQAQSRAPEGYST